MLCVVAILSIFKIKTHSAKGVNMGKKFNKIILLALIASGSSMATANTGEWVYQTFPGDTLTNIAGRYLANPDDWPMLKLRNVANAEMGSALSTHGNIVDPTKLLAPGISIAMPLRLMRNGVASAKIVSLKGKVERVAADGSAKQIDSSVVINQGDTLRTGDASTVLLQFADGSQAFMLANSKMTMTELRAYTTTGIADTRLKLDSGRIETAVKPLISGARYEVQTPATQIGVRGTNFRVAADPAFARTEVIEGKVATEASSQHVDLPAGFGSKTETGKPPAPPVELLAQPNLDKNPAEMQRLPIQIAWADVPKAVSYRALISADKTFSTLVSDTVFTKAEAKFDDLPDGKYAVKVRAIDPAGLEGKDSVREFTVDARPEPPAPSAEARSILENQRAEFKWSAAPALRSEKVSTYHFQLAADKDFSKLVADATATENSAAKSDLKPGEYFWRVASKLANGKEGRYSETKMLAVNPLPPLSPILGVTGVGENMLLFNWTAPIPAQKFEFQLARDAEFKTIVASNQTSDKRLYVPRPVLGSEYFARVRLTTPDNKISDYSEAQKLPLPQRH
jgi:hypothetical protein